MREPGPGFELAGVLAQGSERSRRCAEHYGVPLYGSVEELPDDVDAACVVVRGGLLGGRGVELACDLMARRIHVIQEHPLHHDELAEALRAARRHGVLYRLNSFYVNVEPVRRFVAAARELLGRQPALFVDAACGFQLAYSLLDVLGSALGGVHPWAFAAAPPPPEQLSRLSDVGAPFRSLDGTIAGVPLTLRIQNQLDPRDPDNFAHVMHRVTIGTEGGDLTLLNTHGPLVWSARPRYPTAPRDAESRPHFDGVSPEDLTVPSAAALGPAEAPSFHTIFRSVWPAGVRRAVEELRRAVLEGEDALRQGQYHLTLCRLWQEIASQLGPPEFLHGEELRALVGSDLAALAGAAR